MNKGKFDLHFIVAISLSFTFISCSTNPITGSRQLLLLPDAEVQTMALTQYREFISANKILDSKVNKDALKVKEIGSRIALSLIHI